VRRVLDDGSVVEAPIQQNSVGTDYFRTLSVPVVAGREFSVEMDGTGVVAPGSEPPTLRNILLNVSAAQDLGFSTPEMAMEQLLETDIRTPEGENRVQSLRVIGVVADTQFSSIMLPPVPQYYGLSAQNGFVAVKLAPGTDRAAVTSAMEATWNNVMSSGTFAPVSPDLLDGNMLRREQFEARVILGSTGLAMIIALLGLYGLVAATVVKRVKEIGVRKVMGADRTTIVSLLLWQFSKPVLVANLIAWPFGFWAITQWLQRFPYQLDTQLIVLSGVGASVAALLIAWLTVGVMAAKAASVKPVLALRYE
jgi:putative ABC transport system permease protein